MLSKAVTDQSQTHRVSYKTNRTIYACRQDLSCSYHLTMSTLIDMNVTKQIIVPRCKIFAYRK